MSKHTPLPWHRSQGPNCDVRSESGRKVALTYLPGAAEPSDAYIAECRANADLIVHRVNAFDDMLAALKAIYDNGNLSLDTDNVQIVREAIAKAEERE